MAVAVLITLFIFSVLYLGDALSLNYYDESCPDAELIISNVIREAVTEDKTVSAALLRMHFHDCFIRGCDGSVLLDSAENKQVEKVGPPNLSLHSFYVIDNAKKAVEAACPGVVSCADILALAHPSAGGHSLGFSHCSSFQSRLHSFDATHDIDPSMNPSFAASLQKLCPAHNQLKTAGANMDPSPVSFDHTYYKLIIQRKSLFSSDQALLTSPSTKSLVYKYAGSKEAFYDGFVKSMIKMSSLTGGHEVRKNYFNAMKRFPEKLSLRKPSRATFA